MPGAARERFLFSPEAIILLSLARFPLCTAFSAPGEGLGRGTAKIVLMGSLQLFESAGTKRAELCPYAVRQAW
jgi:hypothetical protein